jgi:ubiquinone/menaquinone biosynthesis C-methylase UbiE
MVNLYDDQARSYNKRTGLKGDIPHIVAQKLLELESIDEGKVFLEVGVGTGQIGFEVARKVPSYVGFDLSFEMIKTFQLLAKERQTSVRLIQADAKSDWPLYEGGVKIFFGSRSWHHIPPRHALKEALRLGAPQGFSIVQGTISRNEIPEISSISREMRQNLRAEGIISASRKFWESEILGLVHSDPRVVVSRVVIGKWKSVSSLREMLNTWASKRGLGGVDVPGAVKRNVLTATQNWALKTFGTIDKPLLCEEAYELLCLKFR